MPLGLSFGYTAKLVTIFMIMCSYLLENIFYGPTDFQPSFDNSGRYGGHFYYRLGRKSVDRNRKGYCSGAVASIILIDDDAYMKSK